eukprot:9493897-Pyramimonas_sp.AAC.1
MQSRQEEELRQFRARPVSSTASTSSEGQQSWASKLVNDEGNKRRRGEDDIGGDPTTKFIGHFPRPVLERVRRSHSDSLKAQYPDLLANVEA